MAKIVKKKKKGLGGLARSTGSSSVETSPLRPKLIGKLPPCIHNCPNNNQVRKILMTLSKAEDYEKSGVFKNLYEQASKYFSEATDEWKIQLTENMEIQYTHPEDEPEITKFDVAVQNGKDKSLIKQDESMFLRIVSLKIQPGKMDEFKKLYSEIVIPSFKRAPGCRNAFLTQSISEGSEFISISVWDNKESAVAHETSDEYIDMINKVKHTFSKFYLWKMSLEKEKGSNIRTTDDMKIDHYDVVTGKSFI